MKLNYIDDKEINIEKNDLLGATPYSETLKTIIQTGKTPLTIGLFGGWGVGKSSIIKTVDDYFNQDKKSKIAVFKYDAWKYANDSFRRTFLYELTRHFKLETSDHFDSFYHDKHEEIKTKIGMSSMWWMYLILVFIPIAIINIVPKVEGKEFEWTTFVISMFISAILMFITKSFVQYKISITKPKVFAPEKFEEIFVETVQTILQNKGRVHKWIKGVFGLEVKETEKLVIVIDNIDRCHEDLAFMLLLSIKNFLEQESVMFIIPVDEDEIKKHIEKRGNNPDEFLRKLFNTTVSIKNISEGDLFSFAKKLNTKHGLNYPVEVVSIVSQQFSKNPRKIIQFLNVLQTEQALSISQEQHQLIPKGAITGNLPFLTKLLIIREEWADIFSALAGKPHMLRSLYKNAKEMTLIDTEITEDYNGPQNSDSSIRLLKRPNKGK